LRNAKEDTSRVLLLSQLAVAFVRFERDTALSYAQRAYKLADKINYKKGEYSSSVSLAWCWWSVGEYATALELLLPKIKDIEASGDLYEIISAYAAVADCYRDQGDHDQALTYGFKLQRLDVNCLHCWITNANIASNYVAKKMWDSAQFYIQKGFTYQPELNLEGWPRYIRGNICVGQHKYDSALIYYRQSIPELLNEYNLKDLANVFNSMSDLFKIIDQKDSALAYARNALAVALPRKFAKEAMEAYLLLSQAFEPFNSDSALHYYKIAIVASDTLYNQEKQRKMLSYQFNEQLREQRMESAQAQLRNRMKIYLLLAAVVIFLVIGILLWRNNRHKQMANILLQHQKEQTENALKELKSTQAQLLQSEKMASLGELTAGIAHEIQNPLNFVNNFSDVNQELLSELKDEANKGNLDEVKAIASSLIENEGKINHHGKRADAIVRGMLQHSRSSSGQKEPTDINKLADEYLRLAYQGFRAKDKSFNATFTTKFDVSIGKVNIIPQEIGRVILNLINNAFYAVHEKEKQNIADYEPAVTVSTRKVNDKAEVRVRDNGNGIPQKILDKIFQPFFTTKPTGQGTGLGLSLAYDIVKAHGGEIKVETNEGEGSEFIVQLPIS